MSRWVKFKRALKWLGMSALALLVFLLIIYTTLNIVFGIQLRHTMAELKQQGMPLSWKDIQPAQVPDEDNAVIPLARAGDMLGHFYTSNPNYERIPNYRTLYPKLNQLAKLFDKCATNSSVRVRLGKINNIENWLSEIQAELPALVESKEMDELYNYICIAAERKGANFGIKYSDGAGALCPNLGAVRQIARYLVTKAWVENQGGKTSQAYDTLLTAQKAMRHLDAEPILVFYLVRMACDSLIADMVQTIADNAGCSEEWAKSYIAEISKSLSRQPREKAIDGDICAYGVSSFERVLGYDTKLARDLFRLHNKSEALAVLVFLRPLFKKEFQSYLLKTAEERKYFTMPYYEIAAQIEKTKEETIPEYYFLSRQLFWNYGYIVGRLAASHDAKIEVCRVGLALQIYKGRHGKYPEKLEQLAPDIFSVIPVDPFTGKSLIYKPEGEGFMLYSVGINRIDDHGDETLEEDKSGNSNRRDIVWRCPR